MPTSLLRITAVLSLSLLACGPKARLTVTPQSLCANDIARITWKVRGEPELQLRVGEPKFNGDASDDERRLEPDTLDFLLIARKGKKEAPASFAALQFADTVRTTVVFPTSLSGDTLIASGEKNIARWSRGFQILSVTSTAGRTLQVNHAGRTAPVSVIAASNAFVNTDVSGNWNMRAIRTEAERSSPSTAPSQFSVDVLLRCRRN